MVALTEKMLRELRRARPVVQSFALPVIYADLLAGERIAAREQYVAEQLGLCYHCGHELHGPPPIDVTELRLSWWNEEEDFMRHPVHLHHDHRSGLTLGAVHARCNAVLRQYHGV